jgi:hypothetical protein
MYIETPKLFAKDALFFLYIVVKTIL